MYDDRFAIYTDDVLVGVSADPSAPFAVISPTDGVYVDDCHASRPLCPGVYYMDRTLPTLQNIITRLQVNQSCSQLGLIDLHIPCVETTPSPTAPCIEGSKDFTCSSGATLGKSKSIIIIIHLCAITDVLIFCLLLLHTDAVLLGVSVLLSVFAVIKIDLFSCTTYYFI